MALLIQVPPPSALLSHFLCTGESDVMLEVKQSFCSHEAMPMRTRVSLLTMAEWKGGTILGPTGTVQPLHQS